MIEEDIDISKQKVDQANVRIKTFTTECPVEEVIRLRNKRVNVERRLVDREATEPDFNNF